METKMTETEKLQRHAFELAAAFSIRLLLMEELPPEEAGAIVHPDGKRRGVVARLITDETSYVVVLHEMGHHLSPWGMLRGPLRVMPPTEASSATDRLRWIRLMVEEEMAAWDWAKHYALYWTAAMQQVHDYAYGTYLKEEARIADLVKLQEPPRNWKPKPAASLDDLVRSMGRK